MTRLPGRPRSDQVDRAILDAAFRLVGSLGYDATTMEGVAAEAGVAKTTVYRRFAHKADLVSAALADHMPVPAPPATGSTRGDLAALVTHFQQAVVAGFGMKMLGTLLVQEDRYPELITLFRERLIEPRRRMMAAVLHRGLEAGEIRRGLDVEKVIDMLVGAVLIYRVAVGEPAAGFGPQTLGTLWPALVAREE